MLQHDGNAGNKCTCFMFIKPTDIGKELLVLWKQSIIDADAFEDQVSSPRRTFPFDECHFRDEVDLTSADTHLTYGVRAADSVVACLLDWIDTHSRYIWRTEMVRCTPSSSYELEACATILPARSCALAHLKARTCDDCRAVEGRSHRVGGPSTTKKIGFCGRPSLESVQCMSAVYSLHDYFSNVDLKECVV